MFTHSCQACCCEGCPVLWQWSSSAGVYPGAPSLHFLQQPSTCAYCNAAHPGMHIRSACAQLPHIGTWLPRRQQQVACATSITVAMCTFCACKCLKLTWLLLSAEHWLAAGLSGRGAQQGAPKGQTRCRGEGQDL